MKLLKDIRGQMTILGLLMIFLTLVVLSILMPSILDRVDVISTSLTTYGIYSGEVLLIRLVPLFIIATILGTIAMYAAPRL